MSKCFWWWCMYNRMAIVMDIVHYLELFRKKILILGRASRNPDPSWQPMMEIDPISEMLCSCYVLVFCEYHIIWYHIGVLKYNVRISKVFIKTWKKISSIFKLYNNDTEKNSFSVRAIHLASSMHVSGDSHFLLILSNCDMYRVVCHHDVVFLVWPFIKSG
jgi:hypothetical protein